jgi:hypothetical protein
LFFSDELIDFENEMEQGGSGAVAEIIPLKFRGERLASQSLEKIGGKIMTVERKVGHMNEDTKNRRFHNSMVTCWIREDFI